MKSSRILFVFALTITVIAGCGSDESLTPASRLLDGPGEQDAETRRLRDLQLVRVVTENSVQVQEETTYDLEDEDRAAEFHLLLQHRCWDLKDLYDPDDRPSFCFSCEVVPYGETSDFSLCDAGLQTCIANLALEIASLRGEPLTISNVSGFTYYFSSQSTATNSALAKFALDTAVKGQDIWVALLRTATDPSSPNCLRDNLHQPLEGPSEGNRYPGKIAQFLSGGYIENYHTYREAMSRFVDHTLAVSDWHYTTSNSEVIAGARAVSGKLLSRAAAAHRLVGGDPGLPGADPAQPNSIETPLCTAREPAKGVAAAVDVFRRAGMKPDDILNAALTTDELVDSSEDCDTVPCSAEGDSDPPKFSVRERLAEQWNQGGLLSGSPTMYEQLGLSLADFEEARKFLAEEIRVFSRTREQTVAPLPIVGALVTGAPIYAGTHTPPSQRPPAYFADMARRSLNPRASDIDPATPGIPVWRSSSDSTVDYAEFIDYSVSHAHIALSNKNNVSNAEARSLLFDPIALMVNDGGKERVGRLAVSKIGDIWSFFVYGFKSTDGLLIVQGEDGLSCATDATIEGAACALNPSTAPNALTVVSLTQDVGATDTGFDSAVNGAVLQSQANLAAGTRLYVVRPTSGGKYEPLIGFRVRSTAIYTEHFPISPSADQRAAEILEPSRDWCARSRLMCNKLEFDERVALEDELSEDGDGVETSWKHYLTLARQAAEEADLLGDQVIESGSRVEEQALQEALRAEAALEELQDICGVAVDPKVLRKKVESLGGLNTTVPCTTISQCECPTPSTCPSGINNDIAYSCTAGFCTGDPVETAVKVAAQDPELRRLAECLGSQGIRKVATPGSQTVCAWKKNGRDDLLCADSRETGIPCPSFPTGTAQAPCADMPRPADVPPPTPPATTPPAVTYEPEAAEPLGYFSVVETGGAPSLDVCDAIRSLRHPDTPADERALRLYGIASTNVFHYGAIDDLVRSIGWEARFGAYSAVTLHGAPIYATGDTWVGPGTVWPCSEPARNCDQNQVGLFCNAIDCLDPFARGAMNERLFRAVWALRQTQRVKEEGDEEKASAPILAPTKVLSQASITSPVSRSRPGGSPVFVSTFKKEIDPPHSPSRTGYFTDSTDASPTGPRMAWIETVNGTQVPIHASDEDNAFVTLPVYPVHKTGGDPTDVPSYSQRFFAGLSEASPTLVGSPSGFGGANRQSDTLEGYYWQRFLRGSSIAPRLRVGSVMSVEPYAYTFVIGSNDGVGATYSTAAPGDEAFEDGLELLCEVADRGECDLSVVPSYASAGAGGAKRYLECAADAIERQAALAVFSNIPERAVDALRKASKIGAYPAVGGQYGIAVAELRAALVDLAEVTPLIASELRAFGTDIEAYESSVALAKVRAEIADVQFQSNVVSQMAACGASVMSLSFGSAATCANSIAQIQFAQKLASLSDQEGEITRNQALADFRSRFTTRATNLQMHGMRATKSADIIDAKLAELEMRRAQGQRVLAKALYDDSDVGKAQATLLSVAQSRHKTSVRRYEQAHKSAVQMAFLAKRAIETRLGVRLSEMTSPLPLVEAPSTWEPAVCATSGLNFEDVKREGGAKDYADSYIGDYVTKLEKVVESYRIAHSFHEGQDTAVVSLRDDLLGVRATCDVPVDNLIYNASDLTPVAYLPDSALTADVQRGVWFSSGCREDATGVPLPNCVAVMPLGCVPGTGNFCTSTDDGPTTPVFGQLSELRGQRIGWGPMDGTTTACDPATCGFHGGFWAGVFQFLDIGPGRYRLSWYERPVGGPAAAGAVGFGSVFDDFTVVGVGSGPSEGLPAGNGWVRRYEVGDVTGSGVGVILVVRSPLEPGQLDVAGLMLEQNVAGDDTGPPKDFANTSTTLTRRMPVCEDTDGRVFRKDRWNRKCVKLCADGFSAQCADAAAKTHCYYETSVTFNQRDINAGRVFSTSGFASGNFNYRIESIGLNVVGTAVRDCSGSTTPSTCHGSGYATYSLQHAGPYFVRNHTGADVEVQLFTGNIEHARAVAAERYVTNPLSEADRKLIEPYFRREFQGRPLDGTFVLRIWEEPGFDFEKVQDIQLVLNYRYWTRFN